MRKTRFVAMLLSLPMYFFVLYLFCLSALSSETILTRRMEEIYSVDGFYYLYHIREGAEVIPLERLNGANGASWLKIQLSSGFKALIKDDGLYSDISIVPSPSSTLTLSNVQSRTVESAKAKSEAVMRISVLYSALYTCIPVLVFFVLKRVKVKFTWKLLWIGNIALSVALTMTSVLMTPGALYNPIRSILYDSALALGKLTVPYFLGSCMATLIISLVQRTGKQVASEGASEMKAPPGREQPLYGVGGFLAFVAFRLCAGLFSSIGVFFDGLSNLVSGSTMDASYMILYLLVDAITWFTYFLAVVFLFKKKLIFRSFYCAGFFLQLISFAMLAEAFFWETFFRIVVLSLFEIPILLYLFRSQRVRNTYENPNRFNWTTDYDATMVGDTPPAVTPSGDAIPHSHPDPVPMEDTAMHTDQAPASGITAVFCKHCGRAIDPDSSFCRHCGGPQTTPAGDPPARQRRATRHQ